MSKLPSPWAVASTTPAPVTGGSLSTGGGSGMANPMTALNDIIVGGTSGSPVRLPVGSNGTFLGVSGGVLGYYTPSGGGGTTTNALTINSSGSGGASPQSFNGSSAITISYNTVGALAAGGTAVNSSELLGNTWASPGAIGGTSPAGGAFTSLSATQQFVSTLGAGTAPISVTSTTICPNLNVQYLNGQPGSYYASAASIPTWSTLTGTPTIVTTFGSLSSSAGWLYDNGSGTLSYSTPTAAQVGALASGGTAVNSSQLNGQSASYYQVAYTLLTTLGSLTNASGFLSNNGSGTLSWASPSGMTNPFTLIGQLLVCSASGSPGTPAALPTSTGTLTCSGTTVSWANIVLTPTGGTAATVTLASGMTFAVTGTNATATLAFPASNTTTITMPTVTSTLAFWSGSAPNSNQVAYSIGTTGALGFVAAATYGVLISNTSGVPSMLAGAAGVLVGSASTPPAWSTYLPAAQFPALTGAITTTAGSLATTLAATQSASVTWSSAQTFSVSPTFTQAAIFSSYAGGTTSGMEWYDSTQLCPAYYSNGMKRFATQTCFVQTANGVTSGTSAITMFGTGVGTKTFGTSWVAGQTVRIRMEGVLTTAATPGTSTITMMLTGTTSYTIATTGAVTLTASMTAVHWELDYTMTARSSTSVMGSGMLRIYPTTGSVLLVPFTTTTATTITAIALTADVQSTNSVSSGAVFTSYNATVEVLA